MQQFDPQTAVNGRLPYGWRIAWSFDCMTGILKVTSPDTNHFFIEVNIGKVSEYSPIHKATQDVLNGACIQAKYDATTGVLRYDSAEVLEFWLELHVHDILKALA